MELLRAQARHIDGRLIDTYFPDEGELRRELYPKHLEFFEAGAEYRERCFMAGNRVGKTIAGGCETVYHLTGDYPHWWKGRVFDGPVRWMVAGDTIQTTKDILQDTLLGDYHDMGGGLLPRDCLGEKVSKAGVPQAIESVKVRRKNGGFSSLFFRAYDQGRKIFQGVNLHGIWFDEEPPLDVYSEALIRTATTDGLAFLTFTPLSGMSETVMSFLPQEYRPSA